MSLYQNLVERCFTTCCNDFTSKALSSKEVSPPPPFSTPLYCSSFPYDEDERKENSNKGKC